MIRDTSAQDRPVNGAARPTSVRWRLPAIGLLALAVIGYGLSARFSSARAVSAERLRIAEVIRADLTRDVLTNGRVVAANSPTLYAPYAGTVALKIAAGAAVERGQVLAVIDSPELTSEYEREKAMLEQLTVTVDRQRILAEKQKLLARRTADEAQLALVSAQPLHFGQRVDPGQTFLRRCRVGIAQRRLRAADPGQGAGAAAPAGRQPGTPHR
jgi:HlyD family secretion protein